MIEWTTSDEILFLQSLGRSNGFKDANILDYLNGYIEGAYKRKNWGSIRRGEVIYTAQLLLAKALVLK